MLMFSGASKKLQTQSATLLNKPTFGFSRYFNRAQIQNSNYKTDMTAYHYKPDLIYNIDPAPQYPDEPMLSRGKQIERQKFKDSLEKYRDLKFAKTRYRDRFMTGRLYAHIRHDELRRAVGEIQDKEKDAGSDQAAAIGTIKERGIWMDTYEYDDQFKLPYGIGYDKVVKKRTDMVDK